MNRHHRSTEPQPDSKGRTLSRPREGRVWVVLFLVVLVIGGALFLKTFPGMLAIDERGWAQQAWETLANGGPVPEVPERVAHVKTLIATHVPALALGFSPEEVLRCRQVRLASGSRIDLRFAGASRATVCFERPATDPLILTCTSEKKVTFSAGGAQGADQAESVRAFLASTACGLTTPVAGIGSDTWVRHLDIRLFPALLKPRLTETDGLTLLGPLFKIDQLPRIPGEELPVDALLLPDEAGEFPQAAGLMIKGLKITPSPFIDWTVDFKKELAGVASLAAYANIWEERAKSLSTWVPQLSDDVGTLLGSGYVRFNRPEVLPVESTLLFPMDELHVLRAFHALGIESAPYVWYPRLATPTLIPAPEANWLERNGNLLFSPGDWPGRVGSEPAYFSQINWLASGDIVLKSLPIEETVILYVSQGNVTLAGEKPGKPLIVVVTAGDISVEAPHVNGVLIALDGAGRNQRGRIIFRGDTVIAGQLRAREIAVEKEQASIRFAPGRLPPDGRIPLVLQKYKG